MPVSCGRGHKPEKAPTKAGRKLILATVSNVNKRSVEGSSLLIDLQGPSAKQAA